MAREAMAGNRGQVWEHAGVASASAGASAGDTYTRAHAKEKALTDTACPLPHPVPAREHMGNRGAGRSELQQAASWGAAAESRQRSACSGSTKSKDSAHSAGQPVACHCKQAAKNLAPADHVEASRPGQLRGLGGRGASRLEHVCQAALAAELQGVSEVVWRSCNSL